MSLQQFSAQVPGLHRSCHEARHGQTWPRKISEISTSAMLRLGVKFVAQPGGLVADAEVTWLDTWICIVSHILEMPSLVAVLQCAAGSGLHQAETLPSLDALEFMATFSACFPDAMMATGVQAAARACRQLLCSCPLQVCKKFPGSGNSSVPLAVFQK